MDHPNNANHSPLSPAPVSQHIPHFQQGKSHPYHLEANGIHVELRYKSEAPSLQQKMIQLCQQMT